jgi:hypothetical protein
MALHGNYSVLEKTAGRFLSGGSTGLGMFRASFGKAGPSRNFYAGDAGIDNKSGTPEGYGPGDAMLIPQKSGGLGSRNMLAGGSAASGNLLMGVNAAADLSGAGSLTDASMQLVVSLTADLIGAGGFDTAPNLVGTVAMAADLVGSGDLTGALSLIVGIYADLIGTSSVAAGLRGTASMSASITPFTELSPQSLAAAVWNSVADAIESGVTPREALRLIAAATAGKVSGAAGTTIAIRNAVADSKDRIVATVDSAGNRSAITYDLSD